MRSKVRRKQTGKGVRWYLTVVDDEGREHSHGGFATQRDAKARAAELVADGRRGRYTPPAKLTVGVFFEGEWRDARATADLSPGARDVEAMIVSAWILPHVGEIPLQKLMARDIDRLYATLRARGGRGGKPLAGKSVRNAHAVLSKALTIATARGHLSANPMVGVEPPAVDDSVERTAWSIGEVRRFLVEADEDRLGAIWRLALSTGLRRGELLGLTWDDLNLDDFHPSANPEGCSVWVRRQVLVRPGRVTDGRRVFVRETTKGHRPRRVRFGPEVALALRSWKSAQAEDRLLFGPAWKVDGWLGADAPWVTTEPHGEVVHPDTLLARWKRLVEQAGVTPITLHGARHSYAELALKAGVRLDVLSRQLGHASLSTTARNYLHDNDEAAAEAAAKVAEVLGAEGGGTA